MPFSFEVSVIKTDAAFQISPGIKLSVPMYNVPFDTSPVKRKIAVPRQLVYRDAKDPS